MGLPWDRKTGGWKRGLPGPVEKGRRGLAEVVGIRGEVAAPGKKLEETGFTRAEVLGGRKDKESQKPGRVATSTPHKAPPTPTLASSLMDQTKRKHPHPLWSCLCFHQTQVQPCPTPTSPTHYALASSRS